MTALNPSLSTSAAPRIQAPARSKRLRDIRETLIVASLVLCGVFTLAITATIIGILFTEAYVFFSSPHPDAQGAVTSVSFWSFITGLEWNPLLGNVKNFGIWPLILGTFKIVAIAMAFALPLGLMVAIWLSEYAGPRVRGIIKPALEILAGVPTVVFGYFALTFITPMLRFDFLTDAEGQAWNPLRIENYNALSAGIAVGIMSLPIVTSLSEDSLRAVPRALREGAYGLGASKFETSIRVVTPAALSGIVAAFLLATARAVGETMIVALAAGSSPVQILDANKHFDPAATLAVTQPVQPMTGFMVQIFLGDAPHGTIEYYSSYAVAATLFVITLLLTIFGGWIRARFRQVYH
jgi:phosphate transport system permease protein